MIDLKSGQHTMLTKGQSVDVRPSWSHDGRSVYFASDRGGARQIWKIPAAGGEPAQITHGGGFDPIESQDGRSLFYVKSPVEEDLWRTLPGGGAEVLVCRGVADGLWTVVREGLKPEIDFVSPAHREKAPKTLNHCDPETGREVSLLDLDKGAGLYPGLTVSNDGRILYSSHNSRSELMVINGLL